MAQQKAPRKQYADPDFYEKKLKAVMERLGVGAKAFDWNWDRHGCWVQFRYKDQLYQFDHSVAKARAKGQNLTYGSDSFAQVVLALEDLTRMVERGIYDLSTWVVGMKMLPPAVEIPTFFRTLGFERIPADVDEVKARYRSLAKQMHPDAGGAREDFESVVRAAEQATLWFEKTKSIVQ